MGDELPAALHMEANPDVLAASVKTIFAGVDTDSDGQISFEDFKKLSHDNEESESSGDEATQAAFDELDTDKSSSLSIEEFAPWESGAWSHREDVNKLMELADEDKDGFIT